MYDELVKALRDMSKMGMKYGMAVVKMREAADAIEELIADRDKYKRHSDLILQLPDCNTCGKKAKGNCEFMPAYGDWVRINCAFWMPDPPREAPDA